MHHHLKEKETVKENTRDLIIANAQLKLPLLPMHNSNCGKLSTTWKNVATHVCGGPCRYFHGKSLSCETNFIMSPMLNSLHGHALHEMVQDLVIDIRGSTAKSNTSQELKHAVVNALSTKSVPFIDSRLARQGVKPNVEMLCSIPTIVLYDTKGLEIFDKITYDPDYYLTNSEIDILKNYSAKLVSEYVNENDILIELGVGAMRKTKYLLDAINESQKKVTYFAVDLSESSLRESLVPLAKMYRNINFVGLWGTYHDSLAWLNSKRKNINSKRIYLWLGSSIGNLNRDEARDFLKHFQENGMHDGDLFFCGIDRRNSFEMVSMAYNDRSGLTREFAMNGLLHVNTLFGKPLLNLEKFEYVSIYNEYDGRHEAYFQSLVDQRIVHDDPACDVCLKKGQLINFEYSYKYSAQEVDRLIEESGLNSLGKVTDSKDLYDLHLFFKSRFNFNSAADRTGEVPPLIDWESAWAGTY
jgi:EasF-like predicted methyltransferase